MDKLVCKRCGKEFEKHWFYHMYFTAICTDCCIDDQLMIKNPLFNEQPYLGLFEASERVTFGYSEEISKFVEGRRFSTDHWMYQVI